jgi:hypothetical protein
MTDDLAKTLGGLLDKKFDEKLEPINDRLDKIERAMATKDDLENLSSKDDLENLSSKDDLENLSSKDDLEDLKEELIENIASAVGETALDAVRANGRRIDKLEQHTDHPPLSI